MMVMITGTRLFEPPSVNITGRIQVNITKVLDFYHLFSFIFKLVVNKIKNLPKNKKNVEEKELNVIHEEIYDLWSSKESNLHGYFDGPDY